MTTSDPRIVLLRHGETEWSRTGRHTGRTDVPLTAEGEAQARLAGDRVAALGLRDPLVLASTRQRALRTAELAGLAAEVWDALVEWDYGTYEGLTTPQIRVEVPRWTVWTHPCPGGETFDEAALRADTVLAVALSRLDDRDVVLVGHGHFSRVLLARWAGLPVSAGARFGMSAGAVSVLGFEHDVQQVVSHNLT
ncbi:acid phosphatase [Rhodococcus kronopolitis]|uniref:Acid phosphatase n=1 Tax=Rhodococcus kronopolitis TaxID=1460226 RepID=A0ABV9FQD5_9NOCA